MPARQMSYEEWRRSIEESDTEGGTPAGITRSTFAAVFQWLNRDVPKKHFLSPRTQPSPEGGAEPPQAPSPPPPAPKSGGDKPHPKPKLRLLGSDSDEFDDEEPKPNDVDGTSDARYQQLLDGIPRGLEIDAKSAVVPRFVELSGSGILKSTMLQVEQAFADHQTSAHLPLVLQGWLTRFSAFEYSDANRERLLPFFSAMACSAIFVQPKSSAPALKEALQQLLGRSLLDGEVRSAAGMALITDGFMRIAQVDHDLVLAHAQAIQDCQSRPDLLLGLILSAMDALNKVRPAVPDVIKPAYEAICQHRRNTKKPVFGLVVGQSYGRVHCPCCNNRLHPDDATHLRANRVYVCRGPDCQRPMFYGLDRQTLIQHGLEGRFAG